MVAAAFIGDVDAGGTVDASLISAEAECLSDLARCAASTKSEIPSSLIASIEDKLTANETSSASWRWGDAPRFRSASSFGGEHNRHSSASSR